MSKKKKEGWKIIGGLAIAAAIWYLINKVPALTSSGQLNP